MNANGIPLKISDSIYDAANSVFKEGRQNEVDFDNPEMVDIISFPSAWIDPKLQIGCYIETIMHQLCLGVAKSNFELCSIWGKAKKRTLPSDKTRKNY